MLIGDTCADPRSIIRLFDGTFEMLNPIFNNPDFDDIANVVYQASTTYNATLGGLLNYVLGSEKEMSATSASVRYIRTSFAIGWPLEGFDHDEDEEDDQSTETQSILSHFLDGFEDSFSDGLTDDVNFYYFNGLIFAEFIQRQVISDTGLLLGSLIFIFLFMWFQTRSLFITGFAVLGIVFAFFTANLIYRYILDYMYFGIFHILALFIILGIGADDVFVFYDTWKESHHYPFPSLAHRMWFVYKRACFAMLWTSLTTAIAFIVSAASPFLAVNTFGVFAGLLVLVNYMSIIIYFPTVVIIYHLYFERFKCCCCCPTGPARHLGEEEEAEKEQQKGIIVRFFAGPYYQAITHKIGRWLILLGFAALFATFLSFAVQLEVQEDQV